MTTASHAQDRRVALLRTAARIVLLWEVLLAALWPVLALLGALAAVALLGVPALLPGWLHLALAAAALAGLAVLLWTATRHLRLPGPHDAERRLEHDSGLRHRPFATLRDLPAGNAPSPSTISSPTPAGTAKPARARIAAYLSGASSARTANLPPTAAGASVPNASPAGIASAPPNTFPAGITSAPPNTFPAGIASAPPNTSPAGITSPPPTASPAGTASVPLNMPAHATLSAPAMAASAPLNPHAPSNAAPYTPAPALPEAAALWRVHQARARLAISRLRLRGPNAQLTSHDPYALRAASVLLLAAALVVAGPRAGTRLAGSLAPALPLSLAGPAPVIQAWIQPPAYTGLPPIFLPAAGGTVTVPTGSRLTVSITGAGSRPAVSVAGATLPVELLGQGSYQSAATLSHEGPLRIDGGFSRLAGWTLALIPNEPPTAAWPKLPGRAGTSLATALPWQTAQRWGVAGLQAELRPTGRPDLPALRVPLPLPGTPKSAQGAATPDLSPNPYAGLRMTGTLLARDVSGQHGQSLPADFLLPARPFRHPLARAIADLRRRLALHPDHPADAATDLAALAEAPPTPAVPGLSPAGVMLNLSAAAAALSAKPADATIAAVQERLWNLALALDGALPDASARALDEARENLRRGLEDHANGKLSDRDLQQKLQTLRDALNKRLDDIARQAMQKGALQKFDPQTQHLSSSAIDRTIRKLEQALRDNRTADANQAMSELNRMMEQLKNAHIMTPQETQQAQQQARQDRQQMGAVQDMVQRETTLLDHAQSRAPKPAYAFPPSLGLDQIRPDQLPQALQQELQPQAGTEDPSQQPDALSTPPPPPPSQAHAQDGAHAQAQDARTQRALHRALDALKQDLAQSGHKPPHALDDAATAMTDAAGALAHNDDPPARDAIGRAIAALQQGGQAMSRDQQGQGGSAGLQLSLQPGSQSGQGQGTEEGEDGPGDGHTGGKKDPFGRQVDGNGQTADDPDLRVPDAMEQGRSRAIQDELRRRGADRARPKNELDYIDRLLKPF